MEVGKRAGEAAEQLADEELIDELNAHEEEGMESAMSAATDFFKLLRPGVCSPTHGPLTRTPACAVRTTPCPIY